MTKRILALTAIVLSAPLWSADTPAASDSAAQSPERVIAQFREDLQTKRADLMAKNLTLSAAEAAKFWPLFETFEKEQDAVMSGQLTATQRFADTQGKVSDADALKFINALLERDAKMHELRVKWLAKFQTVVPTKVAARAIQIDRRIGIATQIGISTQVPLIE